MASNMTRAGLTALIRQAVPPPKFVVCVSLDGTPRHLFMVDDQAEAAKAATDPGFMGLFKAAADEGEGHYVRCTMHIVVEEAEPGLPDFLRSLTQGIQTWELNAGKKPASVGKVTTAKSEKAGEALTGQAPKKAAASKKQSSSKKTTAAKKATSSKKGGAAPRGNGGGNKTTAKRRSTKRRTATRR